MWILLLPAAVVVASLVSKAKTGSFNPAELLVQQPAAPIVTPGAQPGLGTVDGHGTGVLQGPVAGVPVPPAGPPAVLNLPTAPTKGIDPNDPNAAAILAAATLAAQQIARERDPAASTQAAADAAEVVKQQIIAAMNTPAADRSPEELALLSGLSSLPTT